MTPAFLPTLRRHLRDQSGEGVISTGIVVLIMALLGAAMWVTFDRIMEDTGERVEEGVNEVGADG